MPAVCGLCTSTGDLISLRSLETSSSCPHPALPQFSRGWGWNEGLVLQNFRSSVRV